MLPRRQLIAAIVEKVLGKSIRLKNVKVLNNDTEDGRHLIDPLGTKIPRGTLIKAMLTVNVDEGSLKQSNVLRTPINVSKTISPPEDSPLLKLCDSFTKYYLGSMGINYQLGMCHTMLSLPQTVLTHITRSLRTCDGLVADLISATTRYKRIRQDLISFFVPLRRGRTLLIVVTRLNPGDDIPNWLQNQLLTQRGITLLTSLKATPRDSQTSVQQGGN